MTLMEVIAKYDEKAIYAWNMIRIIEKQGNDADVKKWIARWRAYHEILADLGHIVEYE